MKTAKPLKYTYQLPPGLRSAKKSIGQVKYFEDSLESFTFGKHKAEISAIGGYTAVRHNSNIQLQ
jgi:hypothetical protein